MNRINDSRYLVWSIVRSLWHPPIIQSFLLVCIRPWNVGATVLCDKTFFYCTSTSYSKRAYYWSTEVQFLVWWSLLSELVCSTLIFCLGLVNSNERFCWLHWNSLQAPDMFILNKVSRLKNRTQSDTWVGSSLDSSKNRNIGVSLTLSVSANREFYFNL